MTEKKPTLEYGEPSGHKARRRWPWIIGAVLFVLFLLYDLMFCYLNTHGS